MSWRQVTTSFRTPLIPFADIGLYVWRGYDADDGWFLFIDDGTWTMSPYIASSYTVNGRGFGPVYLPVNGYIYYSDSVASGNKLWAVNTYSWIVNTTPGYGTQEYWEWDDETETTGSYKGDAWYSGSLPVLNTTTTFSARGSLRGTVQNAYASTIEVKNERIVWERQADTGLAPAGLYSAISGNYDDRIVGLPDFTDQNSKHYPQSLEKKDDQYSYGSIHYDTKWIIGTINSTSGWHEGSEPNVDNSVTFTFKYNTPDPVPDGWQPPAGSNLTITFDQYIIGSNTVESLICEAPIWL